MSPRGGAGPEATPPRPESGDNDDDRARQAWIESMHRAAPGVDWRQIEKENHRRNQARLAPAMTPVAMAAGAGSTESSAGGTWSQRGPTNQTGRTYVTALTGDGTTLLVGSGDEGGGLFSGTPSSTNWTQRGNPIGTGVQQLVVVPGSPETWVAVADGAAEVYFSTNQGSSWQTSSGLPSEPCGFTVTRLLREPGASRMVYLLITVPFCLSEPAYLLLRSDNAGQTFTTLQTGTYVATPDIWTSRVSAGLLYLVTDSGLHSSTNHGASFSLLSTLPPADWAWELLRLAGSESGSPSLYVLASSSLAANTSALYASADGGRTWLNRGDIYTLTADPYKANGLIAASISNPRLVMLGGIDAYRSTDGGVTFSPVNDWQTYYSDPAHSLHADVRGLDFFDYQGAETLFADTDGGTFISQDLGATFNNMTQNGMINAEYYSTLTSKNDPNLVAAASQDQGFQQSTAASGPMAFDQLISGDYGHLTSTNGDHNMLYATYPGFIAVLDHEAPPHGVDGIDFPAGNRSWMPNILADPTNADAVYLTGNPLYRVSLSNGTWTSTPFAQDFSAGVNDYLTAFAISPVNHAYWYAASSLGLLWYSHNQGSTWTRSASMGPAAHYFYGTALLCSPTTTTTCYVGGSGYSGPAVYKTTDGGVTWQAMGNGLPSTLVLGLAFDDPVRQHLYAVADAGPFVFNAASSTWQSIVGGNAPTQGYWSVEGVPALGVMRFGTYGKGIWDYAIQSSPLKFYTVAPCRIIDTRNATGPFGGPNLQTGATRVFAVANTCGIPSTAKSISVNVTVAVPAAAGFLTLAASDITLPGTSNISFAAGAVKANNAIVALSSDGSGGIAVFNGASGNVPFILDVNGYFQ